jgi:hypothetical protein
MELFSNLLVLRGIERLLIIIIAGISIILGCHIYKIKSQDTNSRIIDNEPFLMNAKRNFASIFFVSLGVAILAFSLTNPLVFDNSSLILSNINLKNLKTSTLKYDQDNYLELAKSINTLSDIILSDQLDSLTINKKNLLKDSIELLKKEKESWIMHLYGQDSIQIWKDNYQNYHIKPSVLGEKVFRQMKRISPWMVGIIQ